METHQKPLAERKEFKCSHVGYKAGPWTRKNDCSRHIMKKHQPWGSSAAPDEGGGEPQVSGSQHCVQIALTFVYRQGACLRRVHPAGGPWDLL